MRAGDASDGAERARFVRLLDAAAARAQPVRFWWRDDDAVDATPELERLLALAERFSLPLGVAVIPEPATPALARRLSRAPRAYALQHGWNHANHAPPGAKKVELGDHRPVETILAEIRQGSDRLCALFGEQFLPLLVPPWNRIGRRALVGLDDGGFSRLSLYGPARDRSSVNTHLDIFDWHPTRIPKPRADAYALLCREVERRLQGDAEPIGVLTHHLVHTDESWEFLKDLFDLLTTHPAVEWPDIPTLLAGTC
jgi:hypothetical protein